VAPLQEVLAVTVKSEVGALVVIAKEPAVDRAPIVRGDIEALAAIVRPIIGARVHIE
jgi:hypothetical protein